jgi:hypothetical protein
VVQLVAAWRGLSDAVGRQAGNLPESILALVWAIMAKVNLRGIGLAALAIGAVLAGAILLMRSYGAPATVNHRRARQ